MLDEYETSSKESIDSAVVFCSMVPLFLSHCPARKMAPLPFPRLSCTAHVADHTMITWLPCSGHVTDHAVHLIDHALITFLVTH